MNKEKNPKVIWISDLGLVSRDGCRKHPSQEKPVKYIRADTVHNDLMEMSKEKLKALEMALFRSRRGQPWDQDYGVIATAAELFLCEKLTIKIEEIEL